VTSRHSFKDEFWDHVLSRNHRKCLVNRRNLPSNPSNYFDVYNVFFFFKSLKSSRLSDVKRPVFVYRISILSLINGEISLRLSCFLLKSTSKISSCGLSSDSLRPCSVAVGLELGD
jgi:hypothetical protein